MTFAFAIIGSAHAAGTTETGTAAGATGDAAHGAAAGDSHTGTDATHAGTQAPHGSEAGHGGAFPPFDPTFFASQLLWLALSFGVFYLLMARLAIPRLGGIIETRKNRIEQDLDEARRLKDEADHAAAAYELELSEARNRANAIGVKARDAAKAAADSERQRIEGALAARLVSAEERISAIRDQAMKEVDRIAAETTGVIVQELLGTPASADDIKAAIGGVKR